MENITATTVHLQNRQRKEIVIVEPDNAFADFLIEVLRQETPYSIFRVASGERAIQVVSQLKPDLLILNPQPDSHPDTTQSTMSGFEVFEHLHAIDGLSTLPTRSEGISTHIGRKHTERTASLRLQPPFSQFFALFSAGQSTQQRRSGALLVIKKILTLSRRHNRERDIR